jgi:hypothetical protein
MLKKILHAVSHWFGTNAGEVVTWWDIDALMCGYQCECGKILGAHMIGVHTYKMSPQGTEVDFKWLNQALQTARD